MQETFVRALLSLPDGHVNVRAWLYMVARNLYYSMCRKRKREVFLEDGMEGMPDGTAVNGNMSAGGAPRVTAPRPLGDNAWNGQQEKELLDRLIQKEEEQMLYAALARLAPIKREVLELQYFGGMPLKQVAQIVGMKPENVRVLSHRAKQEVKKYMEEAGYEVS